MIPGVRGTNTGGPSTAFVRNVALMSEAARSTSGRAGTVTLTNPYWYDETTDQTLPPAELADDADAARVVGA
jgi:hypothetical protein